jgi:hypothetical protein
MDRRYFIKSTGIVGSTAVLVPSAIFAVDTAIESIVKHSNEFIEYTSETANKLNDYALGGLLPSLVPLILFAYTQELMHVILFFFLLITSGIVIF